MSDAEASSSEHKTAATPNDSSLSWLHAVIRFSIELAALAGLAYAGWSSSERTAVQWLAAMGLPLLGALIWAVFRTPGDQIAGKTPIIPVPGPIRMAIEVAVFVFSAYGIWISGSRAAAETLLTFAALHYLMTWKRVRWLVTGHGDPE
ncbi:hypothetical protein BH23CHL5_BH23CHL5_11140 [soil metagenome]